MGRFFPKLPAGEGVEPETWAEGTWLGRPLRAMWGCPPKFNWETSVRLQVQDSKGTWREKYRKADQGDPPWWVFHWKVDGVKTTLRSARLFCFLRQGETWKEEGGKAVFVPWHADHLLWDEDEAKWVRRGGEVGQKPLSDHGKKHGPAGGLAKAANQKAKKAATDAKLAAAREAKKARRTAE